MARLSLDTRENETYTQASLINLLANNPKKESANEDIVIPATMLDDVGWEKVPKEIDLKAFGPKANLELTRIHEAEGEKIARKILEQVNYDRDNIQEIFRIRRTLIQERTPFI